MKWLRDTPWWVLAIALALSAIEPVTHFALQRIDNEHAVHSGLHTPDSAIYLACMKMLDNDFFSPYATCNAPNGPNDPAFLPTPFHWLYAVLGEIGRWFGIGEFMFLGLANGFFGFIYLIVVYRFLKTAVPDLANLAFLLWALGGGLGGAYWLISMATGATAADGFQATSFRFVMYELIEGPGLFPILHIPRLYYTASLALGFGFLTALITSLRIGCRKHLFFAALLLFGSALINIRFGAFAWSIGFMYLSSVRGIAFSRTAVLATASFLPLIAAGVVFTAMQWARPIFTETALAIVRESIWPTAFLSTAVLFLPLAGLATWRTVALLPPLPRIGAFAATGYLISIIPLVLAHQLYHGNLWLAGDHAALARMSDYAAVGVVIGALLGWITRSGETGDPFQHSEQAPSNETLRLPGVEWFILWALVFTAAGMSAFGQGAGVQLAPQRFMAMLGVPMAVSAAFGLNGLGAHHRTVMLGCTTAIVVCGLLSILSGSLYFQAPVGRSPQSELFADRHRETITPGDKRLITALSSGIVLTAPELADAVAVRPGVRVVGGIGSTDLSDAPSTLLDGAYGTFWGVRPLKHWDRDMVLDEWCVDYVLVPDNAIYERDLDSLKNEPRLLEVQSVGSGTIFKVTR